MSQSVIDPSDKQAKGPSIHLSCPLRFSAVVSGFLSGICDVWRVLVGNSVGSFSEAVCLPNPDPVRSPWKTKHMDAPETFSSNNLVLCYSVHSEKLGIDRWPWQNESVISTMTYDLCGFHLQDSLSLRSRRNRPCSTPAKAIQLGSPKVCLGNVVLRGLY